MEGHVNTNGEQVSTSTAAIWIGALILAIAVNL